MKNALLPFAVGLGLSAALLVTACGDDDETTPPDPPPPPTLSIVAVQGVGGPRWQPSDPGGVELGHDTDHTVVVTIAVTDFALRPPGTCGSARVCGTAVLRVDPSGSGEALTVQAAQTALEAKLGYRHRTGAVRRLDDALLAAYGERYVALRGNAHRVELLTERLARMTAQD